MKRRRFRLSERAADDLTSIYDYIAAENPKSARRVVDGIQAKMRSIAALGLTGAPADPSVSRLRIIVFRSYLVYFRVTPSNLLVLRILHGRQDISPDDFPESDVT